MRTISFIVIWLLIVAFLLFLYCALRLAAKADNEIEKNLDEENCNERKEI